jgi:hypothetical protein
MRSAHTPAHAPKSSIGANWSAVVKPSETPLPVRRRTSQISATVWTHAPQRANTWPTKKRR